MQAVDFAGLLCSRLCHDLMSPVGALMAGLELLADETEPEGRAQCVEILAAGVQRTADRLKFFRLAFGGGLTPGEHVHSSEAKGALEGLYGAGSATRLVWDVGPVSLPKHVAKLLLTLAMAAGEALIEGGTVEVHADLGHDGYLLGVSASGRRILLDPEVRAALEGTAAADRLTPRAAATLLVHALLEQMGADPLRMTQREGGFVFSVRVPAGPVLSRS